jgi:hypothetical protein
MRKFNGQFIAQQVLASVPADGGGATRFDTDLPLAIGQALADINGFSISGDVLVWLITDNEQDVSGMKTIDPLYQKIIDEPGFRAVYLYPLLKEGGAPAPPDHALVMYLLHYSVQKSNLRTNALADEVGKRIGNAPISWYPFEDHIGFDSSSVKASGQPVEFVDGKLVLPAVVEGVPPEFTLEFHLSSQLRGREIVSGKITKPVVMLTRVPESILVEGSRDSWNAQVSPSSLAIKAKQSSKNYSALLKANDATFHPAGFWSAVWNSTSDPVDATLQLTLTDIQTKMDLSAADQVKNLERIENFLKKGQKSNKPLNIPITFRVEYNSTGRRLLVCLLALFGAGLVAGTASIFLIKSQYELGTPSGEQLLSLPIIGKQSITIEGARAATISKKFGKLVIAPAIGYRLNGENAPRRLGESREDFQIESERDGKAYRYSIGRLIKQSKEPIEHDPILD